MIVAAATLSHSPLMDRNAPALDVRAQVDAAVDAVRAHVRDLAPDVVIAFGPDHFNGFAYKLMPAFCVGMKATSVGDFDTTTGDLHVDREIAVQVAAEALSSEIDVAVSEDMQIDHGFAQTLEMLFGSVDAIPVVPVFINCAAPPLGPARRARLLGAAVGRVAKDLDRRVLLVGSGGLSHDPPVPRLEGSPPDVIERLVRGKRADERVEYEERVVEAARAFADGKSDMQDLNPEWDRAFLDLLENQQLSRIDNWTNEWCEEQAGHSSHEVRTWIAAYAALAEQGEYEVRQRFYEPIREWIAGYATSVAVPA